MDSTFTLITRNQTAVWYNPFRQNVAWISHLVSRRHAFEK